MSDRRAPVQGERRRTSAGVVAVIPSGTISWDEHEEAWRGYSAKHGTSQSAERIAERAGFGYSELVEFLGHEPRTWVAL